IGVEGIGGSCTGTLVFAVHGVIGDRSTIVGRPHAPIADPAISAAAVSLGVVGYAGFDRKTVAGLEIVQAITPGRGFEVLAVEALVFAAIRAAEIVAVEGEVCLVHLRCSIVVAGL